METRRFDPVSLEVLWSRLISIGDEMALTLMRTAFSSVVREARDFACALFDAQGRMIAQTNSSTAGLTGSTLVSVKNVCSVFPPENLVPGDVLITNDPWLCTGHLLDTTVVTPIFNGDRLVGFAVAVAHLMDIGGRVSALESVEVHEEGLWIPVMRLYRAGEFNDDLANIIRSNVRVPDLVMGDIQAEVLATGVGSQRVLELMADEGIDTLDDLANEIIGRTEQDMRRSIERIPDGEYTDETWIDGFDEPLVLRTAIRINGDSMVIDYDGTSPQVNRGINCVLNFTRSFTFLGVKCAVNPHTPNNDGVIHPVEIIAPEGSLLNATHPAPCVGRSHVGHYLTYCVFGALSKAQPERVMAASSQPIWSQVFHGTRGDGRRFLAGQMISGGFGARAEKDGISALSFPGNVNTVPVEVLESDVPLLVKQKAIRPDSGGAGKFRGGCGQDFQVEILPPDNGGSASGDVTCVIRADRLLYPAAGLEGGKPGALGAILKNHAEPLHGKKAVRLKPGDDVLWQLPGAGGFYDPLERDPNRVARDVRDGFVTIDGAREDYGVVLDPETLDVLDEETSRLRSTLRAPASVSSAAEGEG